MIERPSLGERVIAKQRTVGKISKPSRHRRAVSSAAIVRADVGDWRTGGAEAPVFVQSSWRTASTWLWSKLRRAPTANAYCEIFDERLKACTIPNLKDDHFAKWNSKHPEAAPTFLEFAPLVDSNGLSLAHRFPRGVEESAACILHQMPAVGDLHRVGERLLRRQGVAAASITSDDGDLRLVDQPCLGGRWLSIRQQRDRLSTFEITDQRSITMVATPGPVVDPDDHRGHEARVAPSAHGAQQGVVADRYAQAARETRRRSTSKGDRQTMDNLIEPSRAPRPGLEDVVVEAFGEDAPFAKNLPRSESVAPEASARRAALRSASPPNGEDIDCGPGSKPRHMMGTNCSRSSRGL